MFYFKALLWESISLLCPPPTCKAYDPIAILMHGHCAIYPPPPPTPPHGMPYTIQYWQCQYRVKANPPDARHTSDGLPSPKHRLDCGAVAPAGIARVAEHRHQLIGYRGGGRLPPLSLCTILSLPILYGVWHNQGGSGGGACITQKSRNSIAVVWAMHMGGPAQTSDRISCIGKAPPDARHTASLPQNIVWTAALLHLPGSLA